MAAQSATDESLTIHWHATGTQTVLKRNLPTKDSGERREQYDLHRQRILKVARSFAIAAAALGLAGASAEAIEFGLYRDRPIQLERHTKVDFDFIESHSPYLSEFGVINLDTNEQIPLIEQAKPYDDGATASDLAPFVSDLNSQDDYLGTPGQSVPQPHANFIFEAGTRYTLYLKSTYQGQDAGTVYLMDELHGTRSQLSLVEGNPEELCTGKGNLLLWDDTGTLLESRMQQDRDFDDFVVQVRVWCNLAVAPTSTTASLSASGPVVAVSNAPLGLNLAPLVALSSLFVTQAQAKTATSDTPFVLPALPPEPLPEPDSPFPLGLEPPRRVPEPSLSAGLALAGLGFAWRQRRRQRDRAENKLQ
ncbi:MAG: PEP-CTERM sorting domain-containing protein [Cyanobacteria bacterium J06642_2]